MPDEYDRPGTPSNAVYNSMNGHLLLIRPHNFEEKVQTANGQRDAIRATIHVVDTGEVMESTLIFPRVLVTQLRDRIGGKVLGRLTQGAAKPGQNPPWMLQDATDQDIAQARQYEQQLATGQYQQPAQTQPQGQQLPPQGQYANQGNQPPQGYGQPYQGQQQPPQQGQQPWTPPQPQGGWNQPQPGYNPPPQGQPQQGQPQAPWGGQR